MSTIDLHVHTTASDGTFTPTQIIEYAKQKGLSAIAITDHDTVDGIDEAIQAAIGSTVQVIPGIELAASYTGTEIHILGYNIDHHNIGFVDALSALKQNRASRNVLIVENLQKMGFAISLEQLKKMFANSIITRAHIAKYLIEKGYVKDKNEAFEKYIGDGKPCYVKREKLTPANAISLIKNANGTAVLAHPLLYHMEEQDLVTMIESLKLLGLKGIEAIYSTNTGKDESNLRRMARKADLFITGGSDFHGAIKPNIDLGSGKGNLKIPEDLLKNF